MTLLPSYAKPIKEALLFLFLLFFGVIRTSAQCVDTSTDICKGERAELSVDASVTGTIQWYKNGRTSIHAIPGATGRILIVSEPGTYYYDVTDTFGCVNNTCCGVRITFTDLSNLIAGNSGPVCAGSSTQITATLTGVTAPVSFSWAGPNGFSSNLQNPIVANIATTGIYTVTASTSNSCTATATTNVTVNTCTTTCTNTVVTICQGKSVELGVPDDVTGSIQWYKNGRAAGNAIIGATNRTLIVNTAGIYYFGVNGGTGCISGSCCGVEVIIEDLSGLIAGNGGPVCAGSSTQITATLTGVTAPVSFSWAGPNGFSSNLQNPIVVNIATTGIYTVTASTSNSCTATATTNVTVTTCTTTCNNQVVRLCKGQVVDLSAETGLTNIQWYKGSIDPANIIAGANNVIYTAGESGSYFYTGKDSNGCEVKSCCPVEVIVTTLSPQIVQVSPVLCHDGLGDVVLTVTGVSGATYAWSDGRGFGSVSQSPTITNLAPGGYTYTVTVNNGTCSATATASLTVTCTVANTCTAFAAPLTAVVCSPDGKGSTILGVNGPIGSTYAWTDGSGFSSNAQNPTVSNLANGRHNYTVTVMNGTCLVTATTSLTVTCTAANTCTASAMVATPVLCNLDGKGSATLDVIAPTGSAYSWTDGQGFSSNAKNPSVINLTSGGHSYTVTVMNGTCSVTATTSLTVTCTLANTCTAFAAPMDAVSCENGKGKVKLNVNAPPASIYSWTDGIAFFSNAQSPTVSDLTFGIHRYTVTVISGTCTATATTSLSSTCTVPNTCTAFAAPLTAITCSTDGKGSTILGVDAPVGSTYAWTDGSGFSSNAQNPTVSNLANGRYNYTVTVMNGTCLVTATTSLTVTCTAANTCTAFAAQLTREVCDQEGRASATLTSEGPVGSTYLWYGTHGFASDAQHPLVTGLTKGGYSYTVTVRNGTCTATASTSLTITCTTINTCTVAAFPNSSVVCDASGNGNGVATLNAIGPVGSTYTWSDGAGFNSTSQNPTISNITRGGHTYTVTLMNGTCTATATTSLTSTCTSLNTCTVSAGSISPIACNAGLGTVTLEAIAPVGSSYTWHDRNGFISNAKNPTLTGLTYGGHTFTVTIQNGTCTLTATTSLTVTCSIANTCTVILGANTNTVCEGEDAIINAIGVSGIYLWTGTGGTFSSVTQIPTITVKDLPSGTHTFTVSIINGTCTATSTTSIKVNAKPFVKNTLLTCNTSNNTYHVAGDAAIGSTIVSSAGTVIQPDATGKFTILNIPAGLPILITASIGSCKIDYNIVSPNCINCTGLSVRARANTLICPTSNINLSADALGFSGAVNYRWAGPDNYSSTSQNPVISNASFNNSGVYTVTASNGICSATNTVSINVSNHAPPTATAFTMVASCNFSAANNDGRIIILDYRNTDRCDFSIGNTYTGNKTYANANNIPNNGTITNSLTNPIVSTPYTVRVFGANGCYVDKVVILDPSTCHCGQPNCMPYTVQKTKPRVQ